MNMDMGNKIVLSNVGAARLVSVCMYYKIACTYSLV